MDTPKRALDEAFASQPAAVTGKKRRIVATESEVHRATKHAIRDSCKWALTEQDIHSRVVNGQTLWQRVFAD
eukprot:6487459-Amphidinium_carterae.1